MKYGRLDPPALAFRFRKGEVAGVTGNHRLLCKEIEAAFTTHPGLRRVAELGIGQSKAVRHAARREEVGCLWHERHFGVHVGLGAGLHEEPEERPTKHHLDIVLATGRLAGATDRTILTW
jgi:leucyl aminopeptidase (aminopeptidase T)